MNTQKPIYGMYHTRIDQDGKIELPVKARAFLSDNIILIGHGDHFELWDRVEFERQAQSVSEQDQRRV